MINSVGGFIESENRTVTGLGLHGSLDVNQGSKEGAVIKRNSEKGAAMVEYAVLVALVLVMCVVSVETIGQRSLVGYGEVVAAFSQGQN